MEDYRGQHQAPMRDDGAPLWDVTLNNIYPDDAYDNLGEYYYGGHGPIRKVYSRKNRPNGLVTIYRAVPYTPTPQQQGNKLEKQVKMYMSRGVIPRGVDNEAEWYEMATKKLEQLRQSPVVKTEKMVINPGDWVTIVRSYAKEHGVSNLGGEYRIISKMVFARDLYTDGNSLDEWGYDPTPRIDTQQQKNESIELSTILRLAGLK